MKTDSAFERLIPAAETVTITFEGQPISAAKGDTVAAALLLAGVGRFRSTAVSGAPRAPWCMMGACYECLVSIDGASVQGCMTEVREGQVVNRQTGLPALSHD